MAKYFVERVRYTENTRETLDRFVFPTLPIATEIFNMDDTQTHPSTDADNYERVEMFKVAWSDEAQREVKKLIKASAKKELS